MKRPLLSFVSFIALSLAATLAQADDFSSIRNAQFRMLTGYDASQGAWKANLSDPTIVATLNNAAQSYLSSMATFSGTTDNRSFLWNEYNYNTFPRGESIANTLARLQTIAVAYQAKLHDTANALPALTPGAGYVQSMTGVRNQLFDAVKWVYVNFYNEYTPIENTSGGTTKENWYPWEIGAPRAATNIADLMSFGQLADDPFSATFSFTYTPPGGTAATHQTTLLHGLTAAADHFVPNPAARTEYGYYSGSTGTTIVESGSNLTDKVMLTLVSGAVSGTNQRILDAIAALHGTLAVPNPDPTTPIVPAFGYTGSTNGVSADGYKRDGTFIAHNYYDYGNAYGADNLVDLSNVVFVLANTTVAAQITAADLRSLYAAIADSHEHILFQGQAQPAFLGRQIQYGGLYYGSSAVWAIRPLSAILRISELPPTLIDTTVAADFSELVKAGLQAINASDLSLGGSAVTISKYFPLDLSTDANAMATSAGSTYSPHKSLVHGIGDRVISEQDTYKGVLSMYSTRTASYESFNGQNYKGWHLSDGMLYLRDADTTQFAANNYWVTADMNRLPGTTVVAQTDGAQLKSSYTPQATATIQDGTAANNFDGSGTLAVRNGAQANYNRMALVKLQLQAPASFGAVTSETNRTYSVASAKLTLTGGVSSTGTPSSLKVLGLSSVTPFVLANSWTSKVGTVTTGQVNSDGTVVSGGTTYSVNLDLTKSNWMMTWNEYQAVQNVETIVQDTKPVAVGSTTYTFDVTEFVRYRQQSDGAKAVITLLLQGAVDNQFMSFSNARLDVIYNVDNRRSDRSFAGGATLNTANVINGAQTPGGIVAAGMQLHSTGNAKPGDSTTAYDLSANKSYFFFPDEVVMMVSAVQNTGGQDVETILCDRLLNAAASNTFTVDGVDQTAAAQQSAASSPPVSFAGQRFYIQGATANSGFGVYCFDTATPVLSERYASTSASDALYFSRPPTSSTITGTHQTLFIRHAASGGTVAPATFACVLLPGATSARLAMTPDVTVLQNDASVSAVYYAPQSTIAANFWTTATLAANAAAGATSIQASLPCSVVLRNGTDTLSSGAAGYVEVSVADPAQSGSTTPLTLTLGTATTGVIWSDAPISWSSAGAQTVLSIDISALKGRTVNLRMRTGAGPTYTSTTGSGLLVPLQGKVTRGLETAKTTTAQFDLTFSSSTTSGAVGFADNDVAVGTFSQLAVMLRLVGGTASGSFQYRDGAAYKSTPVTYSGGQTYHVRLKVDNTAQTFEAFVTPPGGAEVELTADATGNPAPAQFRSDTTWATAPTFDKVGQLDVFNNSGTPAFQLSNLAITYTSAPGVL